ncbi:MAG: polyprenol phosphomannose-dependent alpha 1,6 mannosyltransferase MptB [Acidimicrobiaceae bacterium]|nr:polyprenol phosphomannose-dependent alpha 1,6 mannosyltransferase MptB [Acidimicrobiaceae bacterium]
MAVFGLNPLRWHAEDAPKGIRLEASDLVEPIVIGLVASVLILAGTLQKNSPFTSKIPGSWFIGVPSHPVSGNPLLEFLARWLVYLGVALACYVWVRFVRLVRKGYRISPRALWSAFWTWITPLMIAGPLFSRDVYSYAAQGEMVARGIDPYSNGPIALGSNSYLATVDPFWVKAKAPYGPLFLYVDGLFVRFTDHNPLVTVLLLRLLALLGVVLIGKYSMRIATSLGKSPTLAFVLVALNPMVMYHFASAGHNDSIMAGLMLAGIAYFLEGRRIVGIVFCALAAAVKIPAIVAVGFLGYNWIDVKPFRKRLRGAALAVIITVVVFGVLKVVSGLGWGWLLALSTPGVVVTSVAPMVALADLAHQITNVINFGASFTTYVSIFRLVGLAMAGLIGLGLLLTSERKNIVRFIGITMVTVVVLGPVIQPWYIAWGLLVLACSPGKLTTWGTTAISLGSIVLGIPGGPSIASWILYIFVVCLAVVMLGARLPFSPGRLRRMSQRVVDDGVARVIHAVGLYRGAEPE